MITASELRKKFLKFFEEKNHAILPSFKLVPENDPTSLFISSGMQPLVPYLMGEKHPKGTRLADIQKCIRTIDIDEVGDVTHHTFFEMLGNWSLGDYFKKESLQWSYEFLTSPQWLGLDKDKLAVSVFMGDEDAPFDNESYEIWKNLGFSEDRIAKLNKEENWWGPPSETGPCGPDSEIFYWSGNDADIPKKFNPEDDRWVEIWNNVFMEYEKKSDGKFYNLPAKNVDTGMGMERMLAVINGINDDYKTELFWPIIQKIEELSGKKYQDHFTSMRIIADHLKASVFITADSVKPSNGERGYILRRLIRRAIREGYKIGLKQNFTKSISQAVVSMYKEVYPEVAAAEILEIIEKEEIKFRNTLQKGLKQFEKIAGKKGKVALISSNPNKVREYRELSGEKISFDFIKAELPEIQAIDSKEVAEYKIIEAYKKFKRPIIVEDTSLHLEAWNGFPGALIKWFIDYLSTQGLLDLTEGKNRKAVSKCVIAYFDGRSLHFYEGEVRGRITEERLGHSGLEFGFDPIFIPEGYEKTFAEMGEEKNQISHRYLALKKFAENKPDEVKEIKDENIPLLDEKTNKITGKEAFDLYQTYGFPIEMVEELAGEKNMLIDKKGFLDELKQHQELSRTAGAGMFKGGLADTKEKTKQLHTVAHLMLTGMRNVLGDHVHQKGSNINGDRLRFDFSHPDKLKPEQIKKIEDYVNEAISSSVDVVEEEMPLEEARKQGAEGAFEDKYGDKVKVFTIGDYSKEICGGPHVKNTGEIEGEFKITKEQSSSAGVRRVKAVLQ
ncbi:MAG: non-canonical purine NTP pyrophosphatase [Candidatus Moraniibacteriota bacterium]